MNFNKISEAANAVQKVLAGLKPEERLAVLFVCYREDGKPGRKRTPKSEPPAEAAE